MKENRRDSVDIQTTFHWRFQFAQLVTLDHKRKTERRNFRRIEVEKVEIRSIIEVTYDERMTTKIGEGSDYSMS